MQKCYLTTLCAEFCRFVYYSHRVRFVLAGRRGANYMLDFGSSDQRDLGCVFSAGLAGASACAGGVRMRLSRKARAVLRASSAV